MPVLLRLSILRLKPVADVSLQVFLMEGNSAAESWPLSCVNLLSNSEEMVELADNHIQAFLRFL